MSYITNYTIRPKLNSLSLISIYILHKLLALGKKISLFISVSLFGHGFAVIMCIIGISVPDR